MENDKTNYVSSGKSCVLESIELDSTRQLPEMAKTNCFIIKKNFLITQAVDGMRVLQHSPRWINSNRSVFLQPSHFTGRAPESGLIEAESTTTVDIIDSGASSMYGQRECIIGHLKGIFPIHCEANRLLAAVRTFISNGHRWSEHGLSRELIRKPSHQFGFLSTFKHFHHSIHFPALLLI